MRRDDDRQPNVLRQVAYFAVACGVTFYVACLVIAVFRPEFIRRLVN